LVGFAGAPFTLSAYLVEGGASREFAHAKRFLFSDPETYGTLLDRLTDATVDYLTLQARAGAHALQLFDTWAGVLSKSAFDTHILPRLQTLFQRLRSLRVPTIYFSTGSAHLLPSLVSVGSDALGVDWRTPLGAVRSIVGRERPLQGNLDPAALLAPKSKLEAMVREVLREIPDGSGHVFNLGHGVLPETKPEAVRILVEAVHRASTPRR
ncbi:MAG TPA: uroporphyrinogen decarboxylase family protein, partial [Thermoplasmata archaeon]|nr:uroporphyrinogen decarboxylase family protein [Thermoplasmata archaeon]